MQLAGVVTLTLHGTSGGSAPRHHGPLPTDPPPGPFGLTAPNAVVFAVVEGVLEAVASDRANGADALGGLDFGAAGGEEHVAVDM